MGGIISFHVCCVNANSSIWPTRNNQAPCIKRSPLLCLVCVPSVQDNKIDALRAKETLDDTECHGRMLRARMAAHPAAVFVGGIPKSVCNERLAEVSSQHQIVPLHIVFIIEAGSQETPFE